MPLRLLFYMCEVLREYTKNKPLNKNDKNIKVPAILPIVLYNGSKVWDVPTEFRKVIYNEELFGNNIINFNYDIIDINNGFTENELMKNKNVSSAIFLLDQKVDIMDFLRRVRAIALIFKDLSYNEQNTLKRWIRNTIDEQIANDAIKILESNKEDVNMMVANNAFIITEMREKAEKEGMEKGIKKGIKQGIEQGIERGIERGIEQGIERGIEQGIEQGIDQGKCEMIINLMEVKYGKIEGDLGESIKMLKGSELDELSKKVLVEDNLDKISNYIKEIITK